MGRGRREAGRTRLLSRRTREETSCSLRHVLLHPTYTTHRTRDHFHTSLHPVDQQGWHLCPSTRPSLRGQHKTKLPPSPSQHPFSSLAHQIPPASSLSSFPAFPLPTHRLLSSAAPNLPSTNRFRPPQPRRCPLRQATNHVRQRRQRNAVRPFRPR